MRPATHNLEMVQGDTFRKNLRLSLVDDDAVLIDYIDLTGCTGKAQMRESYEDPDITAEFVVTVMNQATTKGGVTIYLAPATTEAIAVKKYVWDLQITNAAGDVTTYIGGDATVTNQVTRA
jgi:hypothetical protein